MQDNLKEPLEIKYFIPFERLKENNGYYCLEGLFNFKMQISRNGYIRIFFPQDGTVKPNIIAIEPAKRLKNGWGFRKAWGDMEYQIKVSPYIVVSASLKEIFKMEEVK